jgi:hypothetical protein
VLEGCPVSCIVLMPAVVPAVPETLTLIPVIGNVWMETEPEETSAEPFWLLPTENEIWSEKAALSVGELWIGWPTEYETWSEKAAPSVRVPWIDWLTVYESVSEKVAPSVSVLWICWLTVYKSFSENVATSLNAGATKPLMECVLHKKVVARRISNTATTSFLLRGLVGKWRKDEGKTIHLVISP